MTPSQDDIVIVGAGQGGLAVSWHLTRAGLPHRIVDRGGIGHAWKQHRWDSFCLVTPNWTVNLPGRPYDGDDPDGFMPRDEFVRYLTDWAEGFGAPVTAGVDVRRIGRDADGFALDTSKGPIRARTVVVATATFQHPRIPAVAAEMPDGVFQLHAENYRNTDQAPEGGVLVVGSGQTGCQITEDFLRAGRKVYLCVARTGRLPRRHRGRDCITWQRDIGLLDRTPDMLDSPERRFVGDPHLTGRDGGATVCLRRFAARGATLLGRLRSVEGHRMAFAGDLHDSLAFADDYAADFRHQVDAFIAREGIDAPPATLAELADVPTADTPVPPVIDSLDLRQAGISTVIWATGFAFDFSWIDDLPVDAQGYPVTDCGQSPLGGLYFCGLNWMTRRKSGILYGVADDAREVARRIARRHAHQVSEAI